MVNDCNRMNRELVMLKFPSDAPGLPWIVSRLKPLALVNCVGQEPETLITLGPLRSVSCASALLIVVVEQTIVIVCSTPFVRLGQLQVVSLTVTCASAIRGARKKTSINAAAQT